MERRRKRKTERGEEEKGKELERREQMQPRDTSSRQAPTAVDDASETLHQDLVWVGKTFPKKKPLHFERGQLPVET